MSTVCSFIRLTGMQRRAGGSTLGSLRWATGLLWRSHKTIRNSKNRNSAIRRHES